MPAWVTGFSRTDGGEGRVDAQSGAHGPCGLAREVLEPIPLCFNRVRCVSGVSSGAGDGTDATAMAGRRAWEKEREKQRKIGQSIVYA